MPIKKCFHSISCHEKKEHGVRPKTNNCRFFSVFQLQFDMDKRFRRRTYTHFTINSITFSVSEQFEIHCNFDWLLNGWSITCKYFSESFFSCFFFNFHFELNFILILYINRTVFGDN